MRTLVQLGKTPGLETLGEGIEDWAQLDSLGHERCDFGQGFLFARPLQVAAIEEMFEQPDEAPATPARQTAQYRIPYETRAGTTSGSAAAGPA
jgi:sensor c-di-GMP phosphodiesterase-like protein